MKRIFLTLFILGILPMALTAAPAEQPVILNLSAKSTYGKTAGMEIEAQLKNKSDEIFTLWGFDETATGQPDLAPYIDVKIIKIEKKSETQVFHKPAVSPPIDDLPGRMHELKPDGSWTYTVKPELKKGQYRVEMKFDDPYKIRKGSHPQAEAQSEIKLEIK